MIYLVRHGETEFNREKRLQGQMESGLTDLGRRQALAMANLLFALIDPQPPVQWRIISSPLGRTQATAAIIAEKLGLPVEIDKRLIEMSVGEWQGQLRDDLHLAHPELSASKDWIFKAPRGETFEDVERRVKEWLTEQAQTPGKNVIAVSHGMTGRLLRGAYAGLSRSDTLDQDAPQDAIYQLHDGQLARIACEPVVAPSSP